MSRSYRKPWIVDGYGTKHKQFAKRQANKRIRKAKDVPDCKKYRRFYDPWDISDYRFKVEPGDDFIEGWKAKRK